MNAEVRSIGAPVKERREVPSSMEEYGACFCGLYVTEEWNNQPEEEHEYVPERRPPEKIVF